jgi:hypothetical protein
MAIVTVKLAVNDVVAAAAAVLQNRVEELVFCVGELVLLVPFDVNSAKTTDHRCLLMMIERSHDDD